MLLKFYFSQDRDRHSPAKSYSTTGIEALAKEYIRRSTLLLMASLSPSSVIDFQMASVSPFPTSQDKYHFMWVQISRHFSVQSSSTFRSRKANKSIYILRCKKIEQGKLLYPIIFPSILLNICSLKSLTCSRMPKGWPDKLSPKRNESPIRVSIFIKGVSSKRFKSFPWS